MTPRRSLRFPILLAIAMVALLAVLTVGWVLLAVFRADSNEKIAAVSGAFLAIGTSFIGMLLVGVVLYLVLTIKAINLGRRQSNFIDSVTHELKSPIASMKLHLQTLRRRQVGVERQTFLYDLMLDDIARLNHLVNQVLDAGMAEAGRMEGEVEVVAAHEILKECVEVTGVLHQVPPETIHLDIVPFLVRARRTQLTVLFRNLVDNAVKYAGSPPRVEVIARIRGGDHAVVTFADNGPGIPPLMRRRIFRRFVRLGSELERVKPGTGLGLYLARTIARQIKGRVRVRDRTTGTGAVFELRLPAVPAPLAVEEPRRSAAEAEAKVQVEE